MADPITDLFTLLTTDRLCLISALAFVVFFIVLLVILRIRRIRSEQNWAYNPGKTLKYKWRRG